MANSAPTIVWLPPVGSGGKPLANVNKHLGLGVSFPEFLYLNDNEMLLIMYLNINKKNECEFPSKMNYQ